MPEYLRDGRAPIPLSERTSKVMSANRGKDTGPEKMLRSALWAKGARGYRIHPKDLPGKPDIVYPRQRLVIMVNGCFWHRCPNCNPPLPKMNTEFWAEKFQRNINRDACKLRELEEQGWRTMVVWECAIRADVEKVVHSIIDELGAV